MDTPGHDVESITGIIAGGSQLIVFTTGLGTPVGSPITPVVKVTGNPRTYGSMKDNIDVDVSPVLKGDESINKAGNRIFRCLLEVASGKKTKSEILGHKEFAINRIGLTL
jgi:altronate dehydratase large subunit